MKETLLTLLKIVEIDNKIDQVLDDQKEIPEIITQCQTEIDQLSKQLISLQADIESAETLKKEITSFVEEKKQWITQREERINDVNTQKEFQAAQKEITTAKKEIKDKEAALESLTPRLQGLSSDLSRITDKNQPRIEELKIAIQENSERLKKISAVIDGEQKKRKAIAVEVKDQQILKHYDTIHTRVNPAMSKADAGSCSECGTRILPQTLNLLSIGDTMFYCTRCKRILYLEEMLSGPK